MSVHNKLHAEGFAGGYSTVTRELREVRGPRFKAAAAVSVPIHTDPGEEAQFDFCDLSDWAARWGWGRLWCFGMILCWSRLRIWWFTTGEDRQHTFEGMVRFFEAIGGVPASCRTDRMGALGRSQGRRFVLHPPTVGFAAHHATTITSCKARDAKRKGKVERPFRQLQETFLPEVELDGIPTDLADLNRRAERWLAERVHALASRSTGEPPAARLAVERAFLSPLPRARFDSDYVESRRVHNIVPFISVDGARYSMPAETLGQLVEIRRRVDASEFTVSWAGRPVVTHTLGGRGDTVWDPPITLLRRPSRSADIGIAMNATCSLSQLSRRRSVGLIWVTVTSTSTPPISMPATASTVSAHDCRPLRADQGRSRLPQPRRRRRQLRDARRTSPDRQAGPTSSSSPGSSPSKPPRIATGASLPGCATPAFPTGAASTSSTSSSSRPSTASSSTTSPHSASSPRTGRSCSSVNPAAARPTSPSRSPPSRSRPATAATSPPPTT